MPTLIMITDAAAYSHVDEEGMTAMMTMMVKSAFNRNWNLTF
jgi:hypothetical protein